MNSNLTPDRTNGSPPSLTQDSDPVKTRDILAPPQNFVNRQNCDQPNGAADVDALEVRP